MVAPYGERAPANLCHEVLAAVRDDALLAGESCWSLFVEIRRFRGRNFDAKELEGADPWLLRGVLPLVRSLVVRDRPCAVPVDVLKLLVKNERAMVQNRQG